VDCISDFAIGGHRLSPGRLIRENRRWASVGDTDSVTVFHSFTMTVSYLPPSHPDQPEEIIEDLPSDLPDEDIDKPQPDLVIQVSIPH